MRLIIRTALVFIRKSYKVVHSHIPLVFALIALLLFNTCKQKPTEPPTDKGGITLKLEDVSCTEAWLTLKTTGIQLPTTVVLKQNDQARATINLTTSDTLLYIDSLLPKQNYNFQVSHIVAGSNKLSVTTMDTTSHNFTWQTFTFGQHSSSVLYDVAIINENNIWAVGEIYMRDSLGNPDPKLYNLMKWNGTEWKPERVYFVNSQGQSFLAPMKSIFVFSVNDIWIGLDQIIKWNGNKYQSIEIPNTIFHSWINKMWGTSSSNLYVVGNGGNIAHYNGSSWRKIESGTSLPIMDIFGAKDKRTGEYEILCVSADPNIPGHSQVLLIDNLTVREVATHPLWEPWGIWFVPGRLYIAVGDGLWQTRSLAGTWFRNSELPAQFKESIRGQSLNDIVVCGSFWLLAHYNGVNWQAYLPRTSGSLGGVAIKGNLLVAVGFIENRAVAILGRR